MDFEYPHPPRGDRRIGNYRPAWFGNYNRGSETKAADRKLRHPGDSENTIARLGNYAHADRKLRLRIGNDAPAWNGSYDPKSESLRASLS